MRIASTWHVSDRIVMRDPRAIAAANGASQSDGVGAPESRIG
jgi:hypothetical protein